MMEQQELQKLEGIECSNHDLMTTRLGQTGPPWEQ